MKLKIQKWPKSRGFALVVTLSLMILLTVIAVGLLTLSSISLRKASRDDANARAFSNARLAVIMAIGELQKNAGDDRRITADASIIPNARQPHLVGAWSSWTPGMIANPAQAAPDYVTPKRQSFLSWLVSARDPQALADIGWSDTAPDSRWPRIFNLGTDGYDLRAEAVPVALGGFAWAVSQENTKAKVNVGGPEQEAAVNVALQAQRRPSLALAPPLKQPKDSWNLRASRVISFSQIQLDDELTSDPAAVASLGASFTVHSRGLLTDALKGGLKTDLSLGFEMSEQDFSKASWNGTDNPFHSPYPSMDFASPAAYRGQRALFRPLIANPIVSITTDYDPAYVAHRFNAAGVPTFDLLRSFYRIPYHLYGANPPVVAGRGGDHVAARSPAVSGNEKSAPAAPPPGVESITSIRPVLNRMLYLLSATIGADSRVQLALTPIISLWNPYNAALEIEGAVAYPWVDIPFDLDWEFTLANGKVGKNTISLSNAMGFQFEAQNHGRSVEPYFFCEMTADGDGNTGKPIHFEPGEVRIFTPASPTPVLFDRKGSAASRTVRLRPVDNLQMMNTRGGLTIPMNDAVGGPFKSVTYVMKKTDTVKLKIRESLAGTYNYFVTLEDATRIKDPSAVHGRGITDVQIFRLSSAVTDVTSPSWTYTDLTTTPKPFAVIETFHRTALQSVGNQPIADLVYTTNPRQVSMNHQLASGTFKVAPHFQSTLRSVASFDGAIQTSIDGRRSFWGPTHSASGQTNPLDPAYPFFEIPREPLLSLAAFQHADLASSTFSSANQFANSWASPYLALEKTGKLEKKYTQAGVPIYDTPYLTNEALWDGFFFSGAAPVISPAATGNPATAWKSPIAEIDRSLDEVIADFVADPVAHPLGNSRMKLVKGGLPDDTLANRLLEPAGCTRIGAHLMVDGAFNVNSTDVAAWTAMLSGLRGEAFQVDGGTPPADTLAALPRFRHPSGKTDDNWNGFRALDDNQIRTLAENLVEQIKKRGPFLSLAEFVNRRVEDSDLGQQGAIQAAIEAGNLNANAFQAPFSTANYPAEAQGHIIADTGVGIPGYLTQADVLQSLAPVITCRSDTFTIRGYGESKDASGKVVARAWCEAVVQRTPDFVDPSDAADTPIASIHPINRSFGRRFQIISFQRIPNPASL